MASVITTSFHNSVAEDVLNEIISNTSRYYYYFGNTTPAPLVPEIPLNSPEYIAKTRNNMITLMQVSSNDVSLVLPRNNWTTGTHYEMYTSSYEGTPTNFYVVTDEFNVYKCLDNFSSTALSTVKPTGSDVDPFVTADGYKWKFMYNIPLALRNKFMTSAYIPVSNGLRNRFFSNGEIDSVIIENSGVGYIQETTSITVTGDGTGAILTPVVTGGQIVEVIIANPGVGYSYANITVSSPDVTVAENKAVLVANMSNGNINSQQAIIENLTTPGTIDSVSILNAGVNFTVAPTVTITGDGSGATATAEVEAGSLKRINITNAGSGYTYANVILSNFGTASGYVVSANVSPILGHGRNAVKELFADTLMFYGNLSGNAFSGFTLNNDYQQYGLIKNIRSTNYSLDIADQANSGKYIILTPDSIEFMNIDDVIHAITVDGDAYRITAKQNGTNMNALEVVRVGNAPIPPSGVTYTIGGEVNIVASEVRNESLLGVRTATVCYIVSATFGGWLDIDTILTKGGYTYIVVAKTSGKVLLQPLNGGSISNGDTLVNGSDSITVSSVIEPSANRYTGDILTIDNRSSFYQSAEQSVSTRTVIRF